MSLGPRRWLVLALLVGGLGATAAGCASVAPWQRSRLSHPCMSLEGRMGDAFLAHVTLIREGSMGGEGGAGGGCGCN